MVPIYAGDSGIKKANRKARQPRKMIKIHFRFSSVRRFPWLRSKIGEAGLGWAPFTSSHRESMIHRWCCRKNKSPCGAPDLDIWNPLETLDHRRS